MYLKDAARHDRSLIFTTVCAQIAAHPQTKLLDAGVPMSIGLIPMIALKIATGATVTVGRICDMIGDAAAATTIMAILAELGIIQIHPGDTGSREKNRKVTFVNSALVEEFMEYGWSR